MNHRKLDLQRPCIGSWCQIGHPANAEILARAGFEWVAADCEHGELEDGDIAPFCRAVRLSNAVPLVRVQENNVIAIRRALDLGADGVIVPLVHHAGDARRAVEAAHYPPKGVRGLAWHHGNNWGADFESYTKAFDPLVVVMIESQEAVENIGSIMDVTGVDACLIGSYDLSGSYGITGQLSHPLILEARSRVAEACREKRKTAGQHIVSPTKEDVQTALDQGFRFLALGMDSFFLGQGARQALDMLK